MELWFGENPKFHNRGSCYQINDPYNNIHPQFIPLLFLNTPHYNQLIHISNFSRKLPTLSKGKKPVLYFNGIWCRFVLKHAKLTATLNKKYILNMKTSNKKKVAQKSKKLKWSQENIAGVQKPAQGMKQKQNASRLSATISINFHQFLSKGIHQAETVLLRDALKMRNCYYYAWRYIFWQFLWTKPYFV